MSAVGERIKAGVADGVAAEVQMSERAQARGLSQRLGTDNP